jgi:excisionase family DNA binding protein
LKASAKAGAFFIIKMEVLLMQDTTKTYTVQEVAEILQVRKGYVYDMIYTGRLRALRLSQRRFRITQVALNDFFQQEEKETAANISVYSGRLSTEGLIR